MSMQCAQGVLLFLVRFNNSAWFEIYGVTHSSSSRRSYALLSISYQRRLPVIMYNLLNELLSDISALLLHRRVQLRQPYTLVEMTQIFPSYRSYALAYSPVLCFPNQE